MKVRALIFVRDTPSCPVLHNCEVSSKYSERYSSYRADTKMFTDGRTDVRTDGRTPGSSLYPRTVRSGDKNGGKNVCSGTQFTAEKNFHPKRDR